MNLTLSPDQLLRLFQYYIILDRNLIFLYCSHNILEDIEFVDYLSLTDIFAVKNFDQPNVSIEISTSSSFLGQRLVLQLLSDPSVTLAGQFEYLESTDQFLFYRENQPKIESVKVNQFYDTLPGLVSYQHIMDMIPSEICIFNTEKAYLFLNAAVEPDSDLRNWMIGKKDEEVGRLRNIPDNLTDRWNQLFQKVLETKISESWEEKAMVNGKAVCYLRTLHPVVNSRGEILMLIRYGIDITERKNIEDQLLINEKRYRDLYAFSPILIYSHTLTGEILSGNPAVLSTLGYSEDEILNTNIRSLVPVNDRDRVKKDYLDKVNQDYYAEGIFRVKPKDGEKIIYLYYQNFKIVEESTSFVIGFSHNITTRIRAEKKLRIAKLVTENLAKQKEIFLANMSHEIRTPINGILGLNNLLLKTNLDKQQEKFIALSSESINNLLIIINDILDIEKIAFGKIDFERNPFNVSDKLNKIIQLFQYKAREKGLGLVLDSNIPSDLVVNGDHFRLTQILTNLLSNAIKFSMSGDIQVSVKSIWEEANQITLEFSVKDTGIGIRKEDVAKIFRPFEQASQKTTRKYGGTGLGLSICKKLTEMQGGRIRVESELGKGAEFIVTIPYQLYSGSVETTGHSPATNFTKLAGKRILIGEDVELNQFLIENLLESWGCEVDLVDNGAKIIEMHFLNDYDIILMDIQMPVMDGLTAAEHIRNMSDSKKADIPILAFTASVMSEDILEYKRVKMNDYILKPYSDRVLYEKLILVLYGTDDMLDNSPLDIVEQDSEHHLTDKLYDLTEIRNLTGGDDRRFNKIILMIIKTLTAEIANIREPAAAGDWGHVSKIVHKIKTSLIHIGVNSLKSILTDLEKNYSTYNQKELQSFVQVLSDTTLQVVSRLESEVVSIEAGATTQSPFKS